MYVAIHTEHPTIARAARPSVNELQHAGHQTTRVGALQESELSTYKWDSM
jgi:hypothetical protein